MKDNLFVRTARRLQRELALLPDRIVSVGPFSRVGDATKPRVLANSVPKSGTHLLGKLLEMLGFFDLDIHLLDAAYWDYHRRGDRHHWEPLATYKEFANPRLIQQRASRAIERVRPGQFARAHIGRDPQTVQALRTTDTRHIFIFRDPRDIVVSYVQHATNRPDRNPLPEAHEHFARDLESDEQRIQATITGVPGVQPNLLEFFFAGKLEWLDDPDTCCVRFEDLVGEPGGGSAERQHATVDKILTHLGISSSPELHKSIRENLHGGSTFTFNQGQIGKWREAFSQRNIETFKEMTGTLLQRLGYENDRNT